MRFITKLGAALKMAAAAALGLAALGQAGPAAAQNLPGGTWGLGQAVNLTALVPAGSQLFSGAIDAVSCASPGNCAAIGVYRYITNGLNNQYPFVMNETGGTWGTPAAVAGATGGMNGPHVSCAAPGECAATWNYSHAYVILESGGVWGQAQQVTIGVGTSLGGVSCPAPGDCTAIGDYTDSVGAGPVPFVIDSSAGTWGAPQGVPGFAGLSSPSPVSGYPESVSCTSAGNCVTVGVYNVSSTSGNLPQAFLATETGGSWGQAQNVAGAAAFTPAVTAGLDSVSCGAPGDCAAVGILESSPGVTNNPNTWVANESGGVWGPPQQLPAPAASSTVYALALSCPARGFCVVAGYYRPATSAIEKAFTATYSGGAWTAQDVPGLGATTSSSATGVSCGAPGYCTVAGYGTLAASGQAQRFLADDVNGTWANAQGVPGIPGGAQTLVVAPSCTTPGYCTAAGTVGNSMYTVSEATAATVTLQASAPTLTYGDEGAETLTATVTSPAGGTPTGTVTVTDGTAAVCSITLTNGTGSCTLPATALPGGTDTLTGTYNGDANYVAASGTTTITVGRASSAVTLQASPPTVTYGNEQAGTLTATVTSPAGGTPTGTVTVTDGTAAVCSITLANGTGSCALPAAALPVGIGQLTATYSGDTNYAGASATAAITVTKATGATITLQVSAPAVTYGAEGAGTLTATVTSLAGVTPTGTVTLSLGSASVCSMTLANGTGSCTLAATALPAGTDQLTVTYSGDDSYVAVTSTATITVAQAAYSGTIRLYKMGYCLDDRNNSSSNGAVVQIWRCNGLPSQQWQVESDGTIRHNGLCLDAKGSGTANGTKVQLWACTGNTNQKWDTRNFRIHYDNPAATNKVLDDTGSGGNGTQQQIWTNNGTRNQSWETS